MRKELTLEEWIAIGNKTKEVIKVHQELFNLLAKKLSKTHFFDKWLLAEESFNKLRSHLDNIVCGKFVDLPNRKVTNIFYGKDKDNDH